MATRAHARESVFGMLYGYGSGNSQIRGFAVDILEEKKIKNKQQQFALGLLDGVLDNIEQIDAMIDCKLKEWEFKRIGDMEKAILRLGAYELSFSDTDVAVVINEAVELSKKYGNDKSPQFINGVLDALAKERKGSGENAAVHST